MNQEGVKRFLGEQYEMYVTRKGDDDRVPIDIVGVEGTGNEPNAFHRKYLIVPSAETAAKPVAVSSSAIKIWDSKENNDQSVYGHSRKLSDILYTWHPKGLDQRGCFEHVMSGYHSHSCGRPAKVSYETKELKAKKALPMWGDRNPSPQYFCGGHDPVKRKRLSDERDAKSREKRQREAAEWDRREREDKERHRRADLYDELVAALAAIMDGEGGDPRELARRALTQAKEIKG
jgi:hypothetical protein